MLLCSTVLQCSEIPFWKSLLNADAAMLHLQPTLDVVITAQVSQQKSMILSLHVTTPGTSIKSSRKKQRKKMCGV